MRFPEGWGPVTDSSTLPCTEHQRFEAELEFLWVPDRAAYAVRVTGVHCLDCYAPFVFATGPDTSYFTDEFHSGLVHLLEEVRKDGAA